MGKGRADRSFAEGAVRVAPSTDRSTLGERTPCCRAALRGGACYISAALVHLPIKAAVGRRHPPRSALHQAGPFTSSFPSGHAAADLSFVFGAAQELPLVLPLCGATMAVHWSLVRKRAHYPSDVLAGGALGLAVALVAWKVWPPVRDGTGTDRDGETNDAGPGATGSSEEPAA